MSHKITHAGGTCVAIKNDLEFACGETYHYYALHDGRSFAVYPDKAADTVPVVFDKAEFEKCFRQTTYRPASIVYEEKPAQEASELELALETNHRIAAEEMSVLDYVSACKWAWNNPHLSHHLRKALAHINFLGEEAIRG